MDIAKVRNIKEVIPGAIFLLHELGRIPIQVLVIGLPIRIDDYYYLIPIAPMEKEGPDEILEEDALDGVWWLDSRNYGIGTQGSMREDFFLGKTPTIFSQTELEEALLSLRTVINPPERFKSLSPWPYAQIQIKNLITYIQLLE